jgi:hypothetical protein
VLLISKFKFILKSFEYIIAIGKAGLLTTTPVVQRILDLQEFFDLNLNKKYENICKKIFLLVILISVFQLRAQEKPLNLNKPEREAWFTDLGFGMFIHWSVDVQLGMVISYSMVGASDDLDLLY